MNEVHVSINDIAYPAGVSVTILKSLSTCLHILYFNISVSSVKSQVMFFSSGKGLPTYLTWAELYVIVNDIV